MIVTQDENSIELKPKFKMYINTNHLPSTSDRIKSALHEYRFEADIFGSFLAEHTTEQPENRLPVKDLYSCYIGWAKNNGYRQMNNKDFFAELSRRFEIKRSGNVGKVIIGIAVSRGNPA